MRIFFLNYQEKQIKEEKEKSQKSLQNQAESFKKSIEELKDAKKVVEDKMNQIVQEKAKLQSELENASEFQKKRMDTMHTKASIFDRMSSLEWCNGKISSSFGLG